MASNVTTIISQKVYEHAQIYLGSGEHQDRIESSIGIEKGIQINSGCWHVYPSKLRECRCDVITKYRGDTR